MPRIRADVKSKIMEKASEAKSQDVEGTPAPPLPQEGEDGEPQDQKGQGPGTSADAFRKSSPMPRMRGDMKAKMEKVGGPKSQDVEGTPAPPLPQEGEPEDKKGQDPE